MKIKSNIFTSLLAVFFSLNLFLFVYLIFIKGKVFEPQPVSGYSFEDNKFVTECMNNFEMLSIGDTLLSLQGENLNDIFQREEDIIVFRYSLGDCSDCVNQELQNIAELINHNPELSDKIVIMCNFYNGTRIGENLRIFKKLSLDIPIFDIGELSELQIEGEEIPYYFFLSKNYRVYNCFIPIRSKEYLTNAYVESILKLLK